MIADAESRPSQPMSDRHMGSHPAEAYWRSLLSIQRTGNPMMDDGFSEEMRGALRDVLHEVRSLSQDNASLRKLNADLVRQKNALMATLEKTRKKLAWHKDHGIVPPRVTPL